MNSDMYFRPRKVLNVPRLTSECSNGNNGIIICRSAAEGGRGIVSEIVVVFLPL